MKKILWAIFIVLALIGCERKDKAILDDDGKKIIAISDDGYSCYIRTVEIDGAKYVVVHGCNKCAICPAVETKK